MERIYLHSNECKDSTRILLLEDNTALSDAQVAEANVEMAGMQKDPSQPSGTYVEFVTIEHGGGELLQLPEREREPDDLTCGITLQQQCSGKTVSISTTGTGSELKFMVAVSDESQDCFYMHFGIALITNYGVWSLEQEGDSCQGKCLLVHHIGGGIYVEVWPDIDGARIGPGGMQVYTDVQLDVRAYDCGVSSADLEWFLGEAVLNKLLQRKYSKAFTKPDGKFFDYGETNCLRLAMDVLLSLKAPPEIARNALGVGRQDGGPRSEKEALIIAINNTLIFLRHKEYLYELQKLIDILNDLKAYPHKKVQDKFIGQLERTYHLQLLLEIFVDASESDKLRDLLAEELGGLTGPADGDGVTQLGIIKAIVKAYRKSDGFVKGYGRAMKHLSAEAISILLSELGLRSNDVP